MKRYFSGRAKVLLLAALVLAALTAISGALGKGTTFGERVVQGFLAPLRAGAESMTRQAERFYNYIFRYEALEAANEELKARVAAMEDEARSVDALQRENERLRSLTGLLAEHEDYKLVSTYIIARNSGGWTSTVTINKGSSAGIAAGMCAITAQGQMIGLVTDVGANWATVTTVLDSSLEISAIISSSGYAGMVQGAYISGQAGKLRMDYLPTDAVVRNGDQVITAGSTIYPRDLVLGYVSDAGFDETGVAKYALIEPAADFERLEQVFVITDFSD